MCPSFYGKVAEGLRQEAVLTSTMGITVRILFYSSQSEEVEMMCVAVFILERST